MEIIYFTKYTRQGASSRLRSYQYFPYLEEAGFTVKVIPLFSDKYLEQTYSGKASKLTVIHSYLIRMWSLFKITKNTKVIIEKELFPYLPAWAEQLLSVLGIKYIVDYDDAIFHNYDKSSNTIIRFFLKNKIDTVMRNSYYVIAGNHYLKDRAKQAGAKNIEVIPTVIDLSRYSKPLNNKNNSEFVIGWIGSPTTFKYVQKIAPVLKELASNGAKIHIVGAKADLGFTENLHYITWKEESEVENIQTFDVGIMPLEDSPWEQGKCSYKLIQYMACGLPVVASSVGMNVEVVHENKNGFLANSESEWLETLLQYMNNPELRKEHGTVGHTLVKENFTIASQIQRLIDVITT